MKYLRLLTPFYGVQERLMLRTSRSVGKSLTLMPVRGSGTRSVWIFAPTGKEAPRAPIDNIIRALRQLGKPSAEAAAHRQLLGSYL